MMARSRSAATSAFFGEDNELAGHDQAAVGVLPAGQRLGARVGAGGQIDHRLKGDLHLAAV